LQLDAAVGRTFFKSPENLAAAGLSPRPAPSDPRVQRTVSTHPKNVRLRQKGKQAMFDSIWYYVVMGLVFVGLIVVFFVVRNKQTDD
jgi:hypothetical protein